MKVLIVESPSKAKTISKYLPDDFAVLSSVGHVRSLPSRPGSVLVDQGFDMIYEETVNVKKGSMDEIEKKAKTASQIYLATDPDREGEAIAWHIVELLKEKKLLQTKTSINRISFNEVTSSAILEALKNPRPIDINLVQAQQSRQALDYLVGFTLSPLLWKKMPGCRSAGRVQSIALRLVCEREIEIINFKPQEYWSINLALIAKKAQIEARLIEFNKQKLDKFSIKSKQNADEISDALKEESFEITNVETSQQKRNPQAPFNTSAMQQEASKKLGFSPKKTMQIAQKLYEGVKVNGELKGMITYMRTDSVTISSNYINNIRDFIKDNYGNKYVPNKINTFVSKTKNAQEAHEAIRPTDILFMPNQVKDQLDKDLFSLYSLIWKRTVASQMSNAVFELVNVEIQSPNSISRANYSFLKFDGHYLVYKEDLDDSLNDSKEISKIVDNFSIKEKLKLDAVFTKQHFTEPKPRFSEASIIKKLEELGIGRPSTYATILSVLEERKYVEIQKKMFAPSNTGILLSAFLTKFFEKYVDYNFTANLEEELDQIAKGKRVWKELLQNFWDHFYAQTKQIGSESTTLIQTFLENYLEENTQINNHACPTCQEKSKLILKFGKFGPFFTCSSYPNCTFKKPLNISTQKSQSTAEAFEPNLLGEFDNVQATVCNGPYGHYIKFIDISSQKPIKNLSIPTSIQLDTIDLNFAKKMFILPKVICKHPDNGQDIILSISKSGLYIKNADKNYKIGKDLTFDLGQSEAIAIINNYDKTKDKTKVKRARKK
jgi:DNA topoisomerase-1